MAAVLQESVNNVNVLEVNPPLYVVDTVEDALAAALNFRLGHAIEEDLIASGRSALQWRSQPSSKNTSGPRAAGVGSVFTLLAPATPVKDRVMAEHDAWAPDGSALLLGAPLQIRWAPGGHDCGIAGIAAVPDPAP